jgi:hypothetical protein
MASHDLERAAPIEHFDYQHDRNLLVLISGRNVTSDKSRLIRTFRVTLGD